MNNDFCHDLQWSSNAFSRIVWPRVAAWCSGGELIVVEDKNSQMLDVCAGIDAWQVIREKSIVRGVATRVQYDTGKPHYPYNTFTIRFSRPQSKTEFEKRTEAILGLSADGAIWPFLTIQAYLDADKKSLVSAAVVRTKDLYWYVDSKGVETFAHVANKDGSSTFIVVPWDEMKEANVNVRVWTSEYDPNTTHNG